ncbi:MAG: WG repeat-containing protein [Fibromonadaceae bacterium]|jgi:uncharacterized protein (TIGR02145 family)|nr:WG repeat-containing protein [Fibromonadaceae bacterium]
MNKILLVFIAATVLLFFACRGKTEIDFSIVPVEGANGEYQYIDIPQKGKIVINPQFGRAHLFRDGLALVKTSGREGKWGYIDKKGKYIIAPTYDYAQDFGDGVAWVQMENQTPMLIDKKGKMVLQIDSITAAYPFHKGIAGIKVYSRGQELTMFIDKKGKPVAATMPGENAIPAMNEGLYGFQDKSSKKWGYKNKNGEIAINAQFDKVGFFLDGMAATLNGKKWGAIDKKGNIVINPQYDDLGYDGNGLFPAKVGKKWGWVNKKNETIINPQFDESSGFFGNKLASVQMGSKWGYINREGQIIINPQFFFAFPFNGDYAMVITTDGKAGFIDKTGTYVVSPLYDINEKDIYEYSLAAYQNLWGGLPMQYLIKYVESGNLNYQTGNFGTYDRLKEKIEEEQQRVIAAAAKASEEAESEAEAEVEAEVGPTDNVSSNSFTDSRDGTAYKTVTIGNQIWMAENLNYEIEGSKCYNNNSANCQKYGLLYSWAAAAKACPSGWHLPKDYEWEVLANYIGSDAGRKLKAKSGWDSNGTDEYGFSALPSGTGKSDGTFIMLGSYGYWWSVGEGTDAYYRYISSENNNLNKLSSTKKGLFPIRCLQD